MRVYLCISLGKLLVSFCMEKSYGKAYQKLTKSLRKGVDPAHVEGKE
ncbi:MAG: hypothetical protein ACM3VS_13540 [Candidatus Dadabacteria bacterium]